MLQTWTLDKATWLQFLFLILIACGWTSTANYVLEREIWSSSTRDILRSQPTNWLPVGRDGKSRHMPWSRDGLEAHFLSWSWNLTGFLVLVLRKVSTVVNLSYTHQCDHRPVKSLWKTFPDWSGSSTLIRRGESQCWRILPGEDEVGLPWRATFRYLFLDL